jgi:hypothetical protein
VPVDFYAAGSATIDLGGSTSDTDPNLRMDSDVTVSGQGVGFTMGICLDSIPGGCSPPTPFGSTQFEVTAGDFYEVDLYTRGQGQIACVGCSARGTAEVDPFLQIDPGFGQAADFQLVLSPGIGNFAPGTVPEPSTWAMMLFGFAGLGFLGYRKTRKAGVATV